MNKQNKHTHTKNNPKPIDTDKRMVVTGKEGVRGGQRRKGIKYLVVEEEQALGGKHTMEYTDVILYSCKPVICIML